MDDAGWPESLREIRDIFVEADGRERLELLLEFAMSLPPLPAELESARDEMEQVHECQSPVFLRARLDDGRIFYDIDAPEEAPTVRGFASILQQGLSGATPEEIEAAPLDLYHQLALGEVLSPLRLRGLTALLSRMKRNARELATAA